MGFLPVGEPTNSPSSDNPPSLSPMGDALSEKIQQQAQAVFDMTATPLPPVPKKRRSSILYPTPSQAGTPPSKNSLYSLAEQAYTLASNSLSSPSTPTPPSATPKTTPAKRYFFQKTEHGSFSVKGAFTPGIKNSDPRMVYSLKVRTKEGTVERYVGETERGVERAAEHASNLRKREDVEEASFGILAQASSRSELDTLETRAIEKVQQEYGKESVLNKRKGGGGGAVSHEVSQQPDENAYEELHALKDQLSWKALTNLSGTIEHQFSPQELEAKKVLYIFERTLPDLTTKRYVGVTLPAFSKRLSAHLGHANDPDSSPLEDKTLYLDMHAFWSQFRVTVMPIDQLLEKGFSSRQLERCAIKIFHGFPGGYNLNQGGGGGVPKN